MGSMKKFDFPNIIVLIVLRKGMILVLICPLCNGLQQLSIQCKYCSDVLVDKGKVTDYLDDYSAYEDIETLNQVDGLKNSLDNQQCIHYFYCESCGWKEHVIITE